MMPNVWIMLLLFVLGAALMWVAAVARVTGEVETADEPVTPRTARRAIPPHVEFEDAEFDDVAFPPAATRPRVVEPTAAPRDEADAAVPTAEDRPRAAASAAPIGRPNAIDEDDEPAVIVDPPEPAFETPAPPLVTEPIVLPDPDQELRPPRRGSTAWRPDRDPRDH